MAKKPRIPSLLAPFAVTLLAATAGSTSLAAAQWTDDAAINTTVVVRPGDQAVPKSGVTSDGGRWIAWFDTASGNYDVYAQRFDSKGHAMFAPGGLLISGHPQSSSLVDWDLIVDSTDAAVLTFTDTRNGSDLDVVAYRIASDGTFLWGPDGIVISFNNDFEADPQVTETGNGEFVIVWSNFGGSPGIRMQRLDAAGNPSLALGGATVVSEAGAAPGFVRIVPGLSDEVILSWVRDTSFFTSIKHLRAQAFGPNGAPTWPTPVEVHDAYNLPFAYGAQLRSDGMGGAVLCWHGSNPSRGFLFDAHVQHLDGLGNELLPAGGTLLSGAAGMNHLDPTATWNPTTGKIQTMWTEKNSGQSQSGWFTQQVGTGGNLDWGPNGKQLLPVDSSTKYLSRIEPLGSGAVGVLNWAPNGGFGADALIGTRIDALGNQVWGAPVDLATASNSKSTRLQFGIDADDQAVVFWTDDRNGNPDLFGQNLMPDGTLGATYLTIDVAALFLSAGGTATLSLDAGARFAGASYWLLGSDSGTSPGLNGFGVNLPLNDGTYFQTTLNRWTLPFFSGFRGTLDASGRATATLTIPGGFNPGYAHTVLDHAFVVWGSSPIDLVSEAVPLVLLP